MLSHIYLSLQKLINLISLQCLFVKTLQNYLADNDMY